MMSKISRVMSHSDSAMKKYLSNVFISLCLGIFSGIQVLLSSGMMVDWISWSFFLTMHELLFKRLL